MNDVKRYYYVSLAFYGHHVFKCRGSGAEDPRHLVFYKPHFERYGEEVCQHKPDAEARGPYKVLILSEYVGDKCTEDGESITLNEAIVRHRPISGDRRA